MGNVHFLGMCWDNCRFLEAISGAGVGGGGDKEYKVRTGTGQEGEGDQKRHTLQKQRR